MPDLPPATDPIDTAGPAPLSSRADVCSVRREADRLLLLFGQCTTAEDGSRSVALQHQVSLHAGAAEQLQDLMTALLLDQPPPGAGAGAR